MRFRRRPNLERVRLTQRNMPNLESSIAADDIRLRRAMLQAIYQLDAGDRKLARDTLADALRERWWK